jgi:predicted DNA-binding transcriptional regulator AlpA
MQGDEMKKILRSRDLLARGDIPSLATMYRQIKAGEFPPGRMISKNIRGWTVEEMDAWYASRPVVRDREEPAALAASRRRRQAAGSTGPPPSPATA